MKYNEIQLNILTCPISISFPCKATTKCFSPFTVPAFFIVHSTVSTDTCTLHTDVGDVCMPICKKYENIITCYVYKCTNL